MDHASKQCPRCERDLPIDAYYGGGKGACKDCRSQARQEQRVDALRYAVKVSPGYEMPCRHCGESFRHREPRLFCSAGCKGSAHTAGSISSFPCERCGDAMRMLPGAWTRARNKGTRMLCPDCRRSSRKSVELGSGLIQCRGPWCSHDDPNGVIRHEDEFRKYQRGRETYCRVCMNCINRASSHRDYIDASGFVAALHKQGFQCAVGCGYRVGPDDKHTMIDHCHETNTFRGILCAHCNFALGHAFDDATRLRLMANYIEQSKGAPKDALTLQHDLQPT